ncbi:hypothetical protein [Leuconostoc citreum]|nr:hypothetical protein [Leuconostoc citreum]CDX66462.1 Protein of unknown function [Leuconostoc citreum]
MGCHKVSKATQEPPKYQVSHDKNQTGRSANSLAKEYHINMSSRY